MGILLGSITAAVTAGVVARESISARGQIWGRVFASGSPEMPPRAAITFDDGPTAGPTDQILDILGEAGVPAAFFVIGENVRRCPGLVRRMHAEGHLIGNHSYHHAHGAFIRRRRYWRAELEQTNRAIFDAAGVWPRLFRPPMGIRTPVIASSARRAKMLTVTWSRRAFDGVKTTAPQVFHRLIPPRAGDVLMLHDGVEPNSPGRDPAATVAAVLPVLLGLRHHGVFCVRLDRLLDVPAYWPLPGESV